MAASFASRNMNPSALSGRQTWMMYALISTRSPTESTPRVTSCPASSITVATPPAITPLCDTWSKDSARWLATAVSMRLRRMSR